MLYLIGIGALAGIALRIARLPALDAVDGRATHAREVRQLLGGPPSELPRDADGGRFKAGVGLSRLGHRRIPARLKAVANRPLRVNDA